MWNKIKSWFWRFAALAGGLWVTLSALGIVGSVLPRWTEVLLFGAICVLLGGHLTKAALAPNIEHVKRQVAKHFGDNCPWLVAIEEAQEAIKKAERRKARHDG